MNVNKCFVYILIFYLLCCNFYSVVIFKKINEANELMDKGNISSALNIYKRNISRFSDDSIILYKYSMCLYENNDYEQAYKILYKVLLKYPDPKILTLQAKICIKLNRYKEAEELLMKASNIVPNKFEPLYWLFTLYKLMGDNERAVEMGKYILSKKIKKESYYIENLRDEIASYIKINKKMEKYEK